MGEIVNLRRTRKRRTREEEAKAAEANRVRHGRPAAERRQEAAERTLEAGRLAGHRLDREDGDA